MSLITEQRDADTSSAPFALPPRKSGVAPAFLPGLGRVFWSDKRVDAATLITAIAAVPISIAVSESLLSVALLSRLVEILRGRADLGLPRIFWLWLTWVGLEIAIWAASPRPWTGRAEISHLLLIAAVFIVMPALADPSLCVMAWRGLLAASALASIFLIGDVLSRLIYYHRELLVDSDPSTYLRSGGLLNNWMVYATVEVVVFAGIIAFCSSYPEQKRFWLPVLVLNVAAIVLSLTRMLWVCCFVLVEAELFSRRSKLRWLGAFIPVVFFFLGPGFLRARIRVSVHPSFYANAERIQMLEVGWRMIKEHPFRGIGPGGVEVLYRHFLPASEPMPVFYGHLHDNLLQLAAQFGVPVALAGAIFTGVLFMQLYKRSNSTSSDRDRQFLCRAGLLGLLGFVVAGIFDYTYGHSLGLIVVFFAALAPLVSGPTLNSDPGRLGSRLR